MDHKFPVFEAALGWFIALPKQMQALGAAVAIFSVGAASALTLSGFGGLPTRVEMNTTAIQEVRAEIASDRQIMQRALCILELQVEAQGDPISPLIVQRRCP